jgi:hypothetical protein
MISINKFLQETKLAVEKKALNKWFYSDFGTVSKKLIYELTDQMFDYLSSNDVYVNINDVNFEKLVTKDLNESIVNFLLFYEDHVTMDNFKDSARHWSNKERDRLMEFAEIFDFEKLRPILELTKKNNGKGGRPGFDAVYMFKILVIQAYYNLSDEKTSRKIKSDEVIKCFLGYPETFPCKSTIWNFREKISEIKLYDEIWDAFKMITIEGKYLLEKNVMQDTSFYTADKGQKKKDYPSWQSSINTTMP